MVGRRKTPAGKSVQLVPSKEDNTIRKELDGFKQDLFAEIAKILGEVKAIQLLGIVTDNTSLSSQDNDEPIFIPDNIGTGQNIEAEINIEDKETDSSSVDDAVAILRKMKQKEKKND